MKMSFLFGHVFWGVLLLLWGLSLILKGLNIVDLPLVKIFIAIVIILFGLRLLIGPRHFRTHSVRGSITSSGSTEYTSVFGSQTVDLTDIKPDAAPLDVTAVFGSTYVILPNDINFEITPTAVFGSCTVPPKPSQAQSNPAGKIFIEANAVFGKVEFEYKPPTRHQFRSSSEADSTKGVQPDSL